MCSFETNHFSPYSVLLQKSNQPGIFGNAGLLSARRTMKRVSRYNDGLTREPRQSLPGVNSVLLAWASVDSYVGLLGKSPVSVKLLRNQIAPSFRSVSYVNIAANHV